MGIAMGGGAGEGVGVWKGMRMRNVGEGSLEWERGRSRIDVIVRDGAYEECICVVEYLSKRLPADRRVLGLRGIA